MQRRKVNKVSSKTITYVENPSARHKNCVVVDLTACQRIKLPRNCRLLLLCGEIPGILAVGHVTDHNCLFIRFGFPFLYLSA